MHYKCASFKNFYILATIIFKRVFTFSPRRWFAANIFPDLKLLKRCEDLWVRCFSICFFIYKYTIQDIIIFCFSLSRCLYACYKSFFGLSNLFVFHGSQCSDNCTVTAYKCFSCYCQMMLNMNFSFFPHVCEQS